MKHEERIIDIVVWILLVFWVSLGLFAILASLLGLFFYSR